MEAVQAALPERLGTPAQRRWCRDRAPPAEVVRGAVVCGRVLADRGEEICRRRASLNPYLARQMSDSWVPMDLCSSTGLKASLSLRSLRGSERAKKEDTQGFTQVQATVAV